ncbi:hypothetical protein D3C84_663920 [compost metagenome]
MRHPPGGLKAGNQHQQRGTLIEQQGRPKGLRREQPDKKTQHQAQCRKHTEGDGIEAQLSPLKNRLLKARQPGYLRSIITLFEIDLHTTPVFSFAHAASSYDITVLVKFSYSIALSKDALPVARLKP